MLFQIFYLCNGHQHRRPLTVCAVVLTPAAGHTVSRKREPLGLFTCTAFNLSGGTVVETKETLKVVRTRVRLVLIHSKMENGTLSSLQVSTQVKRRRWRWIGHVLRQQTTALTRIALRWTPDGQRKRGRPKDTWRRTVEREMKEKGWTWGRRERVSADRHRWRALVEALCAT